MNDGRYTSKSGHSVAAQYPSLWANNGLMHCTMIGGYKQKHRRAAVSPKSDQVF